MPFRIKMMPAPRPKAITSSKVPLRVWWWCIEKDGTKMEGHDNIGWATSRGNSYETALARLKALKAQEVADI